MMMISTQYQNRALIMRPMSVKIIRSFVDDDAEYRRSPKLAEVVQMMREETRTETKEDQRVAPRLKQ